MLRSSALLAFLAATAFACPADSAASTAQGPWAQCGGINWTGGTTCQAGWSCQAQNPYYSQCLQGSSGGSPSSAAAPPPASSSTAATLPSTVAHAVSSSTTAAYVAPTTASSSKAAVATTASSSKAATSTSAPSTGNSGLTYKTSITYYGAGDTFGSGNCNTNTVACFFYTNPGYAAAVSQNLYGVGDGQGQGPACGTCWKLTAQTDSSGNKLSNAGNSIVVMVNNLCPADSNPLCSQPTTSDVNQYGANVNFDLCRDSGAAAALFGSSGVGLAVGTAQQVDCSQWSGTIVH